MDTQATHILSLIDKAIVEKGEDYVYQPVAMIVDDRHVKQCNYLEYADNEQQEGIVGPGCLVGHVLAYDGVPLASLQCREGEGATVAVRVLTSYSPKIASALRQAQAHQDTGGTWGGARRAYIDRINNGPGDQDEV